MMETFAGIVLGFLSYFLAELRRRQKAKKTANEIKSSGYPPPPGDKNCNSCFFFKEFKKRIKEDDDTRRIKAGIETVREIIPK